MTATETATETATATEAESESESETSTGAQAPPRAKRWWILALALALATLAAWAAPKSWPAGEGQVRISFAGERVIESPVAVGSRDRLVLTGESAGRRVEVEFPAGIPVDSVIVARVQVSEGGETIRPGLGQVSIALVLADGREELVPSVRLHEDTQALEARRRPPIDAAVVLALLGLVVVFWLTEFFPLFVTSLLIPVVLVFSGVAGPQMAMEPFFSPIIVLFFAGFLMAEALRSSGLDQRVAIGIVAKAGKSPATLFAALMCTSAFLSMWMSNTAAVAVLTPIALAITEPLRHLGYRKAVVLGIAYAGTLGGVGSAIGTPGNQLAVELLDTFDVRTLSFVDWFAFGLPVVLVFLPIIGWYLWKRMGVTVDATRFAQARAAARATAGRRGPHPRSIPGAGDLRGRGLRLAQPDRARNSPGHGGPGRCPRARRCWAHWCERFAAHRLGRATHFRWRPNARTFSGADRHLRLGRDASGRPRWLAPPWAYLSLPSSHSGSRAWRPTPHRPRFSFPSPFLWPR